MPRAKLDFGFSSCSKRLPQNALEIEAEIPDAAIDERFDTVFDKCREVRHFCGTLLPLWYIRCRSTSPIGRKCGIGFGSLQLKCVQNCAHECVRDH